MGANGFCLMDYIRQEGGVTGYTCPVYACDAKSSRLPTLAGNHGLSAFITVDNPWWWNIMSQKYPDKAAALLTTRAHTVVNFTSNAAWYPLSDAIGHLVTYDARLHFEGFLKPTVTSAYTLFIDTDAAGAGRKAVLTITDPTNVIPTVVLDTSSAAAHFTQASDYEYATPRRVPLQVGGGCPPRRTAR